jgi:hypothetical protein
MSTNNSNNNQYDNNSDGFDLSGGTTKRKLTVTGADITLTGSGTNVYTMPATTDTLVGKATTDTLTNKSIDATTNTITNVSNLSVRRNNKGTGSTITGARMETGWGYIAYNLSAPTITATVSFGATFTTAPVVTVAFGGDSTSGTTYGSGGNNIEGVIVIKVHTIGTTSFVVQISKPSNTNFTVSGNAFYQWTAVGA